MRRFIKVVFCILFSLVFAQQSSAQTKFWLKKQGEDSLLQIAYYANHYEHDEAFNGTYWTEGSRARFNFPHGTTQFRTGKVKGWLTHREFFFADKLGNPKIDSVLWAEGQMVDFMRVGTWRKYNLNGQVALEVNYCKGQICGVVSLYYENGAVKTTGELDEKEFPHGVWHGEFPSGKPKFEVNYVNGVNIGWSKHYTEEGLLSEVHFTDNQWSSYYDSLHLYYPKTGRMKARIVRANQLDKIVEAWDEDGKQTVFNSSGSIAGNFPMFDQGYVELSLLDGRVMGEEKRYFDSDKTALRSRTVRNSQDTNRYHRSTFYRAGGLESEYSFLWTNQRAEPKLLLDGPYTSYYANGKTASTAVFRNDFMVDTYRHWNAQGVLLKELSFAHVDSSIPSHLSFAVDDELMSGAGILNGLCRYWNEEGVLIREETYAMGLRDGLWRTYHENGKLATEQSYKGDRALGKPKHYDEKGKRFKFKVECPNQNWGGGFLCSSHKDRSVTDDIGVCGSCGKGTSSGMYGLCASCACKQQKCQMCGRDL
jgi:antitoxin component YwqK of YwqJK toxin-antitoxin module